MTTGNYIIFEGSEGVGKSKLALRMAQHLNALYTFEPYRGEDLPLCSEIFKICCSKETYPDLTTKAREILLLAGRSISQEMIVRPVLEKGETVVTDRSYISGMVYAMMEGVDHHHWQHIAYACKVLIKPDLVVLVKNKENRPKKAENDRYDHEGEKFFRHVESNFDYCLKELEYLMGWSKDIVYTFENDFNYTQEENFKRLLKELGDREFLKLGEYNDKL